MSQHRAPAVAINPGAHAAAGKGQQCQSQVDGRAHTRDPTDLCALLVREVGGLKR